MHKFSDKEGTWAELLCDLNQVNFTSQPALFLDRDGTIVKEVPYLNKPEEMTLLPGSHRTIGKANLIGIPIIMVTNQSGVGRGYYGWQDFCAVQNVMMKELFALGAHLDAVFACPYHIEGKGPYIHDNHPDRKPNPGMLIKAQKLLSIDIRRSWIVGDRATDIGAGYNAGCSGGVLLKTGYGSEPGEITKARTYQSEGFQVLFCESIDQLTDCIPFFKTNQASC